jgi:hypothetical protein
LEGATGYRARYPVCCLPKQLACFFVQEVQSEHRLDSRRKKESLERMQERAQHEQIQREQSEKIESLRKHLAAVVDRTTRIRNAYEREKKHLTGQVCSFRDHAWCYGCKT